MAGAAESKVVLELLLQDKQFVGQVKDAVKNLAKIGKEAEKSSSPFAKMDAGVSKVAGSIAKTIGIIGGLVAAAGSVAIAFAFAGAIEAAQGQEDALNKVAFALRSTGEFSVAAMADVNAFSEALQAQKGIADDAALELFSLAKTYGSTNEQAKLLTDAAIELSAVTGKDVTSSMELLGKTLSGNVGRLKTLNPEFAKLNKYQLETGEAARVVMSLFGGAAATQMQTFSGSVKATKNQFADLQEELGNLVIKNPAIIAVIHKIGEAFQAFGGYIKENSGTIRKFITSSLKTAVRMFGNLLIAIEAMDVVNPFEGISGSLKDIDTWATRAADSMLRLEESSLRVLKAYVSLPLAPQLGFGNGKSGSAAAEIEGMIDAVLDRREELAKAVEQLKFPDAFAGLEVTEGPKKGIEKITDSVKDLLVELDKLPDTVGTPIFVGPPAGFGGGGSTGGGTGQTYTQPNDDGKSMFDFGFPINAMAKLAGATQKVYEDFTTLDGFFRAGGGLGHVADFVGLAAGGEQGARNLISGIAGAVANIYAPGSGDAVSSLTQSLSEDPEAFRGQIDAFIDGIPTIIDNLVENIPYIMEKLAENFGEIIVPIMAWIPKLFVVMVKAMPAVAKALINEIVGGFNYQMLQFDDFMAGVSSGLVEAEEVLREFVEGIPDAIGTELPIAINEGLKEVGPQLNEILSKAAQAIVNIPDAIGQQLPVMINNASIAMGHAFTAAASKFIEGITTGYENLGVKLDGFGAKIDEVFTQKVTQIFKDIGTGIDGFVETLMTSINDTIGNAGREFFQRIVNAASEFANSVKPGGSSGGYLGQVGDKATATYKAITGGATGGMVSGGSGTRDDQMFALKKGELIVDPPLTRKLDAALSNGQMAGEGGSVRLEAIMLQVLAELQKPFTVKSDVSLRNKVFAEIALELNRTNARVA